MASPGPQRTILIDFHQADAYFTRDPSVSLKSAMAQNIAQQCCRRQAAEKANFGRCSRQIQRFLASRQQRLCRICQQLRKSTWLLVQPIKLISRITCSKSPATAAPRQIWAFATSRFHLILFRRLADGTLLRPGGKNVVKGFFFLIESWIASILGLGTEIGNCHFNWAFSVVTYSGGLSRDTVKRTSRCEMVYSGCLSRKIIIGVTKQLKTSFYNCNGCNE